MTTRASAPSDPETSDSEADAPEAPSPEDLANALRFVHLVETQTKARVSDLSASLNALLELLIGEGHVRLEAYEKRKRLTVLQENQRAEQEAGVAITDLPDKYALADLPPIDCASLLHLCKARCCAMPFTLSVQDLDERVVRWNYARPYYIAQGEDGYCVHQEGGRCGVYENRPGICRTYDCRQDRRVWTDFERRIPAP